MKICKNCLLDENIPDFKLGIDGECNYCKLHKGLEDYFPLGDVGRNNFTVLVNEIKKNSKNANYDCVIGLSGGTDSSYLLHIAKNEFGLNPLAVNFDNGWHSEIAVNNIKKIINKLGIDLETYVVNYDEMKDLLLSYMKAGLPWIDGPTDVGIVSSLYKIAKQEKIKYIFVGNNFRVEGRQPDSWTHTDGEQLRYIQGKMGKSKIKTFPNLTVVDILKYQLYYGIKVIKPFYYLDYKKDYAMKYLEDNYGWKYYGGHHHESIFTRFAITNWLYYKFGIDKRKITFSALVRSKQMDRDDALEKLKKPPCDKNLIEEDQNYVIQKLNITNDEFKEIWNRPNKHIKDYPSILPIYKRFSKLGNYILSLGGGTKTMSSFGL